MPIKFFIRFFSSEFYMSKLLLIRTVKSVKKGEKITEKNMLKKEPKKVEECSDGAKITQKVKSFKRFVPFLGKVMYRKSHTLLEGFLCPRLNIG